MLKQKLELKNLRTKIYNKQLKLMEDISTYKISDYDDPRIRVRIGEVRILEEIFDIKFDEYQRSQDDFWDGLS